MSDPAGTHGHIYIFSQNLYIRFNEEGLWQLLVCPRLSTQVLFIARELIL
jgi:hypothetical protein